MSQKNPKILTKFYNDLDTAINVPSRFELFVIGDFNAKLGVRTSDDVNFGLSNFIGKYGTGKRNDNGDRLINFMCANKLYASNTHIKHPCRHRTTRIGMIKAAGTKKGSKLTQPVYSQIDFILCRTRSIYFFTDSRAYGGACTASDHKIVTAKANFHNINMCFRNKTCKTKKYNVSGLASNTEYKEIFSQNISDRLNSIKMSDDPNSDLTKLLSSIT